MSNSLKQSELYAAQDWRTLYQAFTNINFNAVDPVSINQSLTEYAQRAYAEDFNDWNESSSFVAHIDLLSWLAGTIAFRQDVASRENFLETAEARESVLKLARFLSYVPSRNLPLRGLAKIVQIQSDDDLIDSNGINLNNQPVIWNDPDNLDWFEQFTILMNAAFIQTNPYGVPLETANIGSIKTQNYRINTPNNALPIYPFQANVNGNSLPFELTSTDISATKGFTELFPSTSNSYQLCYRNDSQGFSSNNTGFFVYWTQGSLQSQTFQIDTPRENTVIDVDITNINNQDIYVETIDENGNTLITWKQVPGIFTDNVIFNTVPPAERNIYQVITRDNDQISLKFSDGLFGNIPSGRIRVWYRVSQGNNQAIYPKDMNRTTINIPYINSSGLTKRLTINISLTTMVANGASSETTDQIRRRASQTYMAQGRMVTGEDYNLFPLQTNLATKIKAVNRTYSGHSVYMDLNDPTGNHNTVNILGDDGILAYENISEYNEYFDIGSVDVDVVITNILEPLMIKNTVKNYVLNEFKKLNIQPSIPLYWKNIIVNEFTSSGVFSDTNNSNYFPFAVGSNVGLGQQYITNGCGLIFENDEVRYVNEISGNGTNNELGGIVLTPSLSNNSELKQIIPFWRNLFNSLEYNTLKSLLTNKANTEIWWNYLTQTYLIREIITNQLNPSNSILIGTTKYIGNCWSFTLNGLQIFFESINQTRWYFDNDNLGLDPNTNQLIADKITLLPQNTLKTVGTFWQPNKSYNVNDVVYYNDQTWICQTSHISNSNFQEILTDIGSLKVNPLPFDTIITNNDVPDIFIPNNAEISYTVRYLKITATALENDDNINFNTIEINFSIPLLTQSQTLTLNSIIELIDGTNSTITSNIVIQNNNITITTNPIAITNSFGTINFEFPELSFARDDLTEVNLSNNPLKISSNFGEVYYTNNQKLNVPPFTVTKTIDLSVTEIDPSSDISITVLWKVINNQINKSFDYNIESLYEYLDGYSEPRRIIVKNVDYNKDGNFDYPFIYLKYISQTNDNFNLLFWEKYTDQNNYVYRRPLLGIWVFETLNLMNNYNPIITGVFPSLNTLAYNLQDKQWYKFNSLNIWELTNDNYYVGYGRGKNNCLYYICQNNFYNLNPDGLYYRWKRYAPISNRIDPSVSNIIDIFVLTNEYDNTYRAWIANGANLIDKPIVPIANDLKIAFSSFEQFKMFSDEIVWRPVKFKDLFGNSADSEYQGKFVVVKNQTTTLSDGEIKSRILSAIAEFFDASRWDFGETFYFQTMSAYVMLRLATHIDSFAVVPLVKTGAFGNLFELKCNSDELFISTAQPSDIQFVLTNTQDILRIGKN